ncbi:hypothetical protein AgCh_000430 [Apium graveolens]
MKLSIFKKQDKKKDKNLLVAATVIAAMAYQAALSPPGGVASVDATQLQFLLLMVLMTLDLEIRGFSLKRKFQIWIIRVAMWITLSSMTVAYVCAVIATSPTHDLTQLSNTVKALAFAQVTSQLDGHSLDSMPYSVQRNMCCLYSLRLAKNELEGTLPADLGLTLLNLREFYFGGNRLTGPLPPSMTNMSNLVKFDISENNITGPIPYNLGSLPNIQWLSLGPNALGNNMQPGDLSFFNSLVNCTRLKMLALDFNGLTGELPNSIVNLSTTMEGLYLYGNNIYGSIPQEIGKLVNMTELSLFGNFLTGSIPESIGELSKLSGLYLYDNNISGVIPTSIGNITQLSFLDLDSNMLQGSIPAQLFNISSLQNLLLANNSLEGVIPEEIMFSSQLIRLRLSHNLFTGSLPSQIGSLNHLIKLDLSYNKLTGNIPSTLDGCVMLQELYMQGNLFQGSIPSSFKSLRSLAVLDISNNKISGTIPSFFDGFGVIVFLNLSHNKLGGEVPKSGPFSNVGAFSVVVNSELCGGIPALQLPACPCPVKISRNKKKTFSLRNILLLVLLPIGILLALLALICYRRQNSKRLTYSVPILEDSRYLKLSYQDLLRATNEFAQINFLGEGRYGSVYRGVVKSMEHTVAVKVLNVEVRGANKSFLAECETLRNIRHRNLIKIITACSSTDFKGNDFKALVFEFMTNGSLDNWLHPSPHHQGNEKNLTLLQRLNISIDVALGLDYLHHHSHENIIHGDIKPSNILLDENFVAHIGDFGLARFCFDTSTSNSNQTQLSSTGIRGTIGYVPPGDLCY